ncbi:hypothetical protein ACLIMP_03675 [Novosphingobium aerophilum]|uniref:hypothetical protein n=1 Tax=Novosphingobium TaxID=165696 RepID=UPI000A48A0E2|nr:MULTISPECIES: hypothetical protein [unclassified Novosphingobium]TCM37620.1 hypothetical protein EDF59_11015 [Novosphingobium sp. ST904]WRT93374.1 hypothetical protein U9J33_02355 [Novosphingobium sp. RL4]
MSGRFGRIGAGVALALALAVGLTLLHDSASGHRKAESAEASTGTVIVRVIAPALL